MKYIPCLLLVYYCLLSSVQAQVQYHSDSLVRHTATKQYIDFVLARPALLGDSTLKGFGEAQVYYDSRQTNFRTAQTAQKKQTAAFEARGYNKIGSRLHVSGSFLFSKEWQDSLAYSLQGLDRSGIPGYYFVPKAGKFERQTYQGTAHAGYVWKPNKWRSDLQLSYTHHWATRSVDPRMEHYTMQLILKPSVSYQVGKVQTTLQGIWGYANAQTNLSYKHTPYTFGNAFPEYQYRTSYGYGSVSLPLDSANLRQYHHYRGIALQGKVDGSRWNMLWHAQYQQIEVKSTNDMRKMVNYFVRQRFIMDELHLSVLGIRPGINPTSIRLEWNFRQGDDFNANVRRKNYLLDQWDASFSFAQALHTDSRLPKEFGIDGTLLHDQRKDGSTSHSMQRTWMDIGVPLALSYVFPTQSRLRWSVRPSYRVSLKNELHIPATQHNEFSLGIAYPEYYYYGTNALSLQSRLEFIDTKSMKNQHLGWYADFGWTTPGQYNGDIYPGTAVYRGNNTAFRLGISFYL